MSLLLLLPKSLLLLVLLYFLVVAAQQDGENDGRDDDDDDDCTGGFCPNNNKGTGGNGSKNKNNNGSDSCGLWLGPSPIKNAENHGFGLGMFTGRDIAKGETVEGLFYGATTTSDGSGDAVGEILIPLLGSQDIMERHPPLREVLWDEDNLPLTAVEYPDTVTALFVPGLAAVAPCTGRNYNLQIVGKGAAAEDEDDGQAVSQDRLGVGRRSHATAGSWSYRQAVRYRAVRDISAGEELTVECDDDTFDGGNYFLSRFDDDAKSSSSDGVVVCLDETVRVAPSSIPGAGRGLVAKKAMAAGDLILSTPLVPLQRQELNVVTAAEQGINERQLLLNYCWGHADSDLLLLPVGPLVGYLNHAGGAAPPGTVAPNAKIVWHSHTLTAEQLAQLDRRQEFHHYDEIKTWKAHRVAQTHGMGLVADVVATRPVAVGDEILLDYGPAWQAAWERHETAWRQALDQNDGKAFSRDYVDAQELVRALTERGEPLYRTMTEQARNPYPPNINVFCFYAQQEMFLTNDSYIDDDEFVMEGSAGYIDYETATAEHNCFRPCRILERTGGDDGKGGQQATYTVELNLVHNPFILTRCLIRQDLIMTHVPALALRLVDKPYTTDVLLPQAFRHEIGVPDVPSTQPFYPPDWMRGNLRSSNNGGGKSGPPCLTCAENDGFKRKSNDNLSTKPVAVTADGRVLDA